MDLTDVVDVDAVGLRLISGLLEKTSYYDALENCILRITSKVGIGELSGRLYSVMKVDLYTKGRGS